jgi:hypothetical protein
LRIWLEFLFGGQRYDEMLVWFEALQFGEIFGVIFWEVCIRRCNADLGTTQQHLL